MHVTGGVYRNHAFSMQVGLDVYRLGISGGFQHGPYLWQAELAGDQAEELYQSIFFSFLVRTVYITAATLSCSRDGNP